MSRSMQSRFWKFATATRRRLIITVVVGGCAILTLCSVIGQSLGIVPTAEERQATEQAAIDAGRTQSAQSLETLTAVALSFTPTNTLTITPSPTITDTPTITFTPSNTLPATVTNTPQPTNTLRPAQLPETITLYTTNGDIRARSCANTNNAECPVIDVLAINTAVQAIVQVDGTNVNGSAQWWEVIYNGQTLYIHSSLLSQNEVQVQQVAPPPSSGNMGATQDTSPAPVSQWTCVGDQYNCSDFSTCNEVMSYFNVSFG